MPVDERGDMVAVTDKPCPDCGHEIAYTLGCHTYEQDGRWMTCWGCGTAIEHFCLCVHAEPKRTCLCTWIYTEGLNPANPRSAHNETRRPAWLAEAETKS